jgi:general secretion pathway protein F
MDAPDRAAVIRSLQTQGHLPISAELKRTSHDLVTFVQRVNIAARAPRSGHVTFFTRQLADLLAAGVPIDSSLRMLATQGDDSRMQAVIDQLKRDVQSGKAFSEALAEHGDVFDPLYLSLVRAGESGGALETVLVRLAIYREKAEAFHASLISALTYPAILVLVAFLSLFVLMSFVVPRFVPLFSDADQALPMLTQLVFMMSCLFAGTWWFVVPALLVGKFLADRWLAKPANQVNFSRIVLNTPVVGSLIREAEAARFSRMLAMLMRNGLPLLAALKLSEGAMRNKAMRSMITRCTAQVQAGARFSASLRDEAVLPRLALDLVAIGEESGALVEMVDRVADTYESRVERHLKRLLTLLEPVLVLGLGSVIGLVIVAILMAMLSLNELI